MTKRRNKLNIELKNLVDHQLDLAGKVVEAVHSRGVLDQVIIQHLEYDPLLEDRKLLLAVAFDYLLTFNTVKTSRFSVDFFSIERNRLTISRVLSATSPRWRGNPSSNTLASRNSSVLFAGFGLDWCNGTMLGP
jgi:hypothetical protein